MGDVIVRVGGARIHEVAPDFELEDVWALPTPGGPEDFPRLVRKLAACDPSRSFPRAARELRNRVGELLGWANRTVQGVMHVGWVPDGAGGYRGQVAILVKPNGLLGRAYMAAIKPFRNLIAYPALMRMIGRDWGSPDRGCIPGARI